MIQGLVQIFLFQALGELVSHLFFPMIPGPVIGLVSLLVFLLVLKKVPSHIDLVGSQILQHLGLLFIPASVGVILYLPLLQTHALGIATALVTSVVFTLAITALALKLMNPKPREEDEHAS
jgi:holin-like protein